LLGSGATSQIFLATREPAEPGRDPLVAIKVPRPEYRDDPDFARRARQGAQTLLGLNHPHVVRIERIDCYPTATCEIPYLVLEYCEGGTLVDLVKAQLPSPREAAVIVSKIAQAIQYLHRSHAIHRDIKPANIVFRENEPKITDFELVR
jgi:serine/threonine-protein kinase PpkA